MAVVERIVSGVADWLFTKLEEWRAKHRTISGSREFEEALSRALWAIEDQAGKKCNATKGYTDKITGPDRVEFDRAFKWVDRECRRLALVASQAFAARSDSDLQDDSEWVKAYFRFRFLTQVIEDECKRSGIAVKTRET
jgi:hypothetical protein